MAPRTAVSGSRTTLPGGVVGQPDRQRHVSSPRRALDRIPPRSRARRKCSSLRPWSPLIPRRRRSLKLVGSYSPSSSRMRVSVWAQICSSRCQSALLRASREHSRPSTIPARPRDTSATRCWNPSRSAEEAPEWPWSMSITWIRSAGQPSATARPRRSYWRRGGLGVVGDLVEGGLADVEVGVAAEPGRGHLAAGIGTHGGTTSWAGNGAGRAWASVICASTATISPVA